MTTNFNQSNKYINGNVFLIIARAVFFMNGPPVFRILGQDTYLATDTNVCIITGELLLRPCPPSSMRACRSRTLPTIHSTAVTIGRMA